MLGKTRHHDTVAGRVGEIVDRVGSQAAANAIYKSRSYVYKLADPDTVNCPTVQQGWQLDRIFKQFGGLHAPLTDLMVSRTQIIPPVLNSTVEAELMDVVSAVGRISDAVITATHIKSPGGNKITPNERAQIQKQVAACMNELREISLVLEQGDAKLELVG